MMPRLRPSYFGFENDMLIKHQSALSKILIPNNLVGILAQRSDFARASCGAHVGSRRIVASSDFRSDARTHA
jgi:hypothetical protein